MVCSKCAKCCQSLFFIAEMPFPSLDIVDYYRYHNIVLINMGDGRVKFVVQNKCVNLDGNLCKIFDDRPSICRGSPSVGFGISQMDGCTDKG